MLRFAAVFSFLHEAPAKTAAQELLKNVYWITHFSDPGREQSECTFPHKVQVNKKAAFTFQIRGWKDIHICSNF